MIRAYVRHRINIHDVYIIDPTSDIATIFVGTSVLPIIALGQFGCK